MGITEEAGKVGTAAMGAMQSQPLAIALLIVNCVFVGFCGYILSIIGENAQIRNKTQMELIGRLITECRHSALPQPQRSILRLPPLPTVPINDKP